MVEFVREMTERGAAVVAAVLPARLWPRLPSLPIRNMAIVSAALTIIAGGVVGVGGFLTYSQRIGRETAALMLNADEQTNAALLGAAAFTPIVFLFTPVGMLATYMALSGLVRAATWIVDEPIGDPVLTVVDATIQRISGKAQRSHARRLRERAEGAEVPDRMYPAQWARLADADFVIVASRRKSDWDKGTFVITSDKWYVIGEPFEMQLAEGLRTIYPLKEHTTRDVVRRSVHYELPPLRTRGPKTP